MTKLWVNKLVYTANAILLVLANAISLLWNQVLAYMNIDFLQDFFCDEKIM